MWAGVGLSRVFSVLVLPLLVVQGIAVADPTTQSAQQAVPVMGYRQSTKQVHGSEGAQRVAVVVRVVSATDPVIGEGETAQSKPLAVDQRIQDLADQLSALHYRTFKLQYEERLTLSLLKRDKVLLKDGHELALRPIYLEGNRVGLWFRWNDKKGTRVLDTRVHMTCGESVVAGTEAESGDRGVIIALSARPSR